MSLDVNFIRFAPIINYQSSIINYLPCKELVIFCVFLYFKIKDHYLWQSKKHY